VKNVLTSSSDKKAITGGLRPKRSMGGGQKKSLTKKEGQGGGIKVTSGKV